MVEYEYKIRKMTKDEVNVAIDWAAAEGWNPGLYDAECFYATDPDGFYIGLLNNEPISCISTVVYDDKFAFLGFYMVKPQFRRKGYGIKIWKHALKNLKTQNIELDGVTQQQEYYKKSGFKFAYRTIRYEGTSIKFGRHPRNIVDISELSFLDLLAYDNNLFPSSRSNFLKCWINQPESKSLGILEKGKIVGYGVIRKCRIGYKIGPLFADNKYLAEQLFQALNNHLEENTQFFLDVPEPNSAATAIANKYNMKKVFETARMYTKDQPKLQLEKIFGITSFELG